MAEVFHPHAHDPAKKGRIQAPGNSDKNETDHSGHPHELKSSLDGGSSCRSTPLTPLSSKSASDVISSQDSISSPNSPFQRFIPFSISSNHQILNPLY